MKPLYETVEVKKSCFVQAAKWMAVDWKTTFYFPEGTLRYFSLLQYLTGGHVVYLEPFL